MFLFKSLSLNLFHKHRWMDSFHCLKCAKKSPWGSGKSKEQHPKPALSLALRDCVSQRHQHRWLCSPGNLRERRDPRGPQNTGLWEAPPVAVVVSFFKMLPWELRVCLLWNFTLHSLRFKRCRAHQKVCCKLMITFLTFMINIKMNLKISLKI